MNKIASHLDFHAQALMLRSRRNEILASNIANAATPNFKARDVSFDAQIKKHVSGTGPLKVTHGQHLDTAISVGHDRILFRDPINPSMDGNTVELAVEQMEFSENVTRYQTTLTFLNNRISGFYTFQSTIVSIFEFCKSFNILWNCINIIISNSYETVQCSNIFSDFTRE